jgi:ferrous iron transport protein B
MLKPAVLLLGKESAGKSALAGSLTGAYANSANFRGTTIACENYDWERFLLIDTPGIDSSADSEAAKEAISRLSGADLVVLVVPSMHAAEDLRDLLPLTKGKRGIVAMTFRDKQTGANPATLPDGLCAIHLDGRRVNAHEREALLDALEGADPLPSGVPPSGAREPVGSSEPSRSPPTPAWSSDCQGTSSRSGRVAFGD